MFGSEVLELAIGVIFIYTLISIICTAIREGIEAWLKTRAAYLEYGIRELLHDRKAEGLAKSLYNHPLIYSLFLREYIPRSNSKPPGILANGANLPSYIPAKNFAQALMDIAARGPDTDVVSSDPNAPIISLENIRVNILNLGNPAIQRVLLTAIDSAQGDLNRVQANIEAWYDSSMDRISGWYKRSTQWILFWIGLFTAIVLNINPLTLVDHLYRNDNERAMIIARAEAAVADTTFLSRSYQQAREELEMLALPIGWGHVDFGWPGTNRTVVREIREGKQVIILYRGWWDYFFSPVLGWLLTAFAATLGAPFWFDMLNKVMVIRSTVKPHEKSPEESSEDRQFRGQGMVNNTADEQRNMLGKPISSELAKSHQPNWQPHWIDIPAPKDKESDIDGCGVHTHNSKSEEDITLDEELPDAKGGVA